jgi:hypothetical protein
MAQVPDVGSDSGCAVAEWTWLLWLIRLLWW